MCEKATTSAQVFSQSSQLIWVKFSMLVGVMNHMLILSHLINIKGENLTCDFMEGRGGGRGGVGGGGGGGG